LAEVAVGEARVASIVQNSVVTFGCRSEIATCFPGRRSSDDACCPVKLLALALAFWR